jgi:hypothetical protein
MNNAMALTLSISTHIYVKLCLKTLTMGTKYYFVLLSFLAFSHFSQSIFGYKGVPLGGTKIFVPPAVGL